MCRVLDFSVRRRFAHDADVEAMDKALAFTDGSFVAAAKLLDMSPQRFRNIVFKRPCLKAKWGKRRGYPGRKFQLPFRITPHGEDHVTAELVKECITLLSPEERSELRAWLDETQEGEAGGSPTRSQALAL